MTRNRIYRLAHATLLAVVVTGCSAFDQPCGQVTRYASFGAAILALGSGPASDTLVAVGLNLEELGPADSARQVTLQWVVAGTSALPSDTELIVDTSSAAGPVLELSNPPRIMILPFSSGSALFAPFAAGRGLATLRSTTGVVLGTGQLRLQAGDPELRSACID